MKTVYHSYVRFSTPDQIKGDSLRRQLEGARAYVKRQGGILDESKTFSDLGVSAFRGANLKRGSKLGAFLKAVENGEIKPGSGLVVEAIGILRRYWIGLIPHTSLYFLRIAELRTKMPIMPTQVRR